MSGLLEQFYAQVGIQRGGIDHLPYALRQLWARVTVPIIFAFSLLPDDSEKIGSARFRRQIVPRFIPESADARRGAVRRCVVGDHSPVPDFIGRRLLINLASGHADGLSVSFQTKSVDIGELSRVEARTCHYQGMVRARHYVRDGGDRAATQIERKTPWAGLSEHAVHEQAFRPRFEPGCSQAQHPQSRHAPDIQRMQQWVAIQSQRLQASKTSQLPGGVRRQPDSVVGQTQGFE